MVKKDLYQPLGFPNEGALMECTEDCPKLSDCGGGWVGELWLVATERSANLTDRWLNQPI